MPESAKLAGRGPAAEQVTPGLWFPLGSCDATASGSEDAQVQFTRGQLTLNFCQHHTCLYELVLAADGWQITHDNRGR